MEQHYSFRKVVAGGLGALQLTFLSVMALGQQITTPSNTPLVIGGSGLKIGALTNASAAQAPSVSNFKAFGPDGSGNVSLLDFSSISGGGWSQSGNNLLNANSGNVGIGVASPQFKLDLNGDINLPSSGVLRLGGQAFLRVAGSANTALGINAGANLTTGANNFFLGANSGLQTASGSYNTFIGVNAGRNTQQNDNTFIGNGAGFTNGQGTRNTFIGSNSGFLNSTAGDNTFIGLASGYNNASGQKNTGIGSFAGSGRNLGDGNTFLGYQADGTAAGLTNATAIGYNAKVDVSNALILGSGVNVGIGVTSPTAKLEIKSGTAGASGLKFTDFTNANAGTIVTSTKFLTVDASGNVVMGTNPGLGGRQAAAAGDNWIVDGNGVLSNNNSGAVTIGKGISRLPGDYALFVSDGILTEKVKVALKDSDDWSDKVFEDTYRLRTLGEVEQFVKEHNHLPGIPSAAEMVRQGNDLHKTDALLLEKIEELTLYMIDIKKENEKLKKEIEQLKRKRK